MPLLRVTRPRTTARSASSSLRASVVADITLHRDEDILRYADKSGTALPVGTAQLSSILKAGLHHQTATDSSMGTSHAQHLAADATSAWQPTHREGPSESLRPAPPRSGLSVHGSCLCRATEGRPADSPHRTSRDRGDLLDA